MMKKDTIDNVDDDQASASSPAGDQLTHHVNAAIGPMQAPQI